MNKHTYPLILLAGSLLAHNLVQAACFSDSPLTRPDSRYEAANASGSEVKDKETGLVWQRCVVGMQCVPAQPPRKTGIPPPKQPLRPNGVCPPKPSWKA